MAEEGAQVRDDTVGAVWRSFFNSEAGKKDLFGYTDRAFLSYERKLLSMGTSVDNVEYDAFKLKGLSMVMPAPVSAQLIGMGMWRAKGYAEDVIQILVTRIESSWREAMKRDLNLYPPQEWKGKGWDFCDSMDPENELEGYSDGDIPDPEKGEEGYPRLFIENRIYCSRVFRKLHLEVACRQDGLQVLHMVMYPRYTIDLPLLCLDLVVAPGGRVTLCIIDACPVTKNLTLPAHYMETMQELQQMYLTDPSNQRQVPEWGKAIFSPQCICMTPKSHEELAGFLKYSIALHRAHLLLAHLCQPVGTNTDLTPQYNPTTASRKREELLEAHKRFVDHQLSNTKTARVLEVAFGKEWSERYMRELMFDFDPENDPSYVDSTVLRLYEYFGQNPEVGGLDDAFENIRKRMDGIKAKEVLEVMFDEDRRMPSPFFTPPEERGLRDGATTIGPLSDPAGNIRKRAEWAMEILFETDPAFRESVEGLKPDAKEMLEDGTLGSFLVDTLGKVMSPDGALAGKRGNKM